MFLTIIFYTGLFILYVTDMMKLKVENLLNYKMDFVQLYPDETRRLSMIRIYDHLSCADKLGDCPIITLLKARKQLLEGGMLPAFPMKSKMKP